LPEEQQTSNSVVAKARVREFRRAQVAKLVIKKWTTRAIAAELKVTSGTVAADIKAVRAEWRETRAQAYDDHVSEVLACFDYLYAEAIKGWERSQDDSVKQVTARRGVDPKDPGSTGGTADLSVTKERSAGDPAFLAAARSALREKCEVLGLYAPKRTDVDVKLGVDDVFFGDTVEESRKEMMAFLNDPAFQPKGLLGPIEEADIDASANGNGNGYSNGNGAARADDDDDNNSDGD